MAIVEMIMPKMGESVMEGTILKWLKQIGDTIEQDEPVLEVATDKVDTEIPSTHSGTLKEIIAQEGEVVEVGKTIAVIETDSETAEPTTIHTPQEVTSFQENLQVIEEGILQAKNTISNGVEKVNEPIENRFYSPLVLNIAKEEGISMQELAYIAGTGMENRVTKKDILAYLEQKKPMVTISETKTLDDSTTQIAFQAKFKEPIVVVKETQQNTPLINKTYSDGEVEIIEMDRMRKMISERMLESKRISPHVTSFVEADVTNMVLWRTKYKRDFQKREGENITYTAIFVEAVAKALKDFPLLNASVEGDKIIRKKNINIGMAVALPNNNLIVPVIHNADQMNLVGLARKINDLANRSRNNQLKPDDLSGGTYTISNISPFGNVMGTPIIVQPQVGILALGAIRKKPAVVETPTGDMIAIRQMMFLSHSYDHRIIDGAMGGKFARKVADYLESFDLNREV
jgi:2-oxoglutarate dehydrogenase E2 component (dihydrolipoamide succinyltransferase)